MRSPNIVGSMYSLLVLTPIKPGLEAQLRAYLEALPRDDSPLARLARTHMARFVVVPEMPAPPGAGVEDPLGGPYLLFTSAFDGDRESYLHELSARLVPEAEEIWGRCIGCPENPHGPALKRYLKHNQIDTGIFFAAYPNATVRDVKHALAQRDQIIEFACTSQGLAPAELQRRFLATFGQGG